MRHNPIVRLLSADADTTTEKLNARQTPPSDDASEQNAVEAEQSNVLLEDVTDDQMVDTSKREAIHMPVASPDFDLDVPETPQPTLIPAVVEEEPELPQVFENKEEGEQPEEEEKTATLQQVVESKEEDELPEEEEKTVDLKLLATSDEAVSAETKPTVIDALEENVERTTSR